MLRGALPQRAVASLDLMRWVETCSRLCEGRCATLAPSTPLGFVNVRMQRESACGCPTTWWTLGGQAPYSTNI
jgi:hypothetical protein